MKRLLFVATLLLLNIGRFSTVDAGTRESSAPSIGVLINQNEYVAGLEGAVVSLTISVRDFPTDDSASFTITSYRPVKTRAAVRDAIAGKLPGVVDTVVLPNSAVTRDDSGYVELNVPIEIGVRTRANLQMSAAGLYPMSIGIVVNKTVVDQIITFVDRLPDQTSTPSPTGTLQVAVVTGLDGPIARQPDFSSTIDEGSLNATTDMVTAIEDLDMVPLTVMASPQWIDALAQYGGDGTQLLERLGATQSTQFLSGPYVNVNPEELVADTSEVFVSQLRRGEDALRGAISDHDIRRDTYLARFGLSARSASLVRDLGFRSIVLTPSAQVDTADGATFLADPSRLVRLAFDSGSIDAALADANLATTMTAGSMPGADSYLMAQHLLADVKAWRTEILARDETTSGRTLILTTLDGSPPSPEFLTSIVAALSTEPDIVAVTLDEAMVSTDLNTTEDGPVTLALPSPDSPSVPAWVTQQSALRTRIDSYSGVLPLGDVRVEMWRGLLDVIADHTMSDERRTDYIDAVHASMDEIAESISLPTSTTFTLGGRDSSIRVTVRNDSDAELTVRVRLTSSKLRFPAQNDPVVLGAGATTAIEVPVEARSNGRFPVVMQLFTPDGTEALGPPITFTARVNALAGLGQLVTGVALLLLISWWVHHLRGVRRRRFADVDDTASRHPSIDRSMP